MYRTLYFISFERDSKHSIKIVFISLILLAFLSHIVYNLFDWTFTASIFIPHSTQFILHFYISAFIHMTAFITTVQLKIRDS